MADEQDRHGVAPEPDDAEETALPGTDDFLDQLARGLGMEGWPGLEASPDFARRQVDEHRAQMKREADVFRDTFATEPGRKCLEILVARTLTRRTFGLEYEARRIEDLTVSAIVREAENNFVASILEAIAFANNREFNRQEA